ncbi:hypothetical protein HU200_035505 [Digitaria exilis]|uniref:Reverse transcriptase zinc-binding domain-containing protein n=1 Tax=Digitaria exilis TaxID=1010633 RepID=A0A835BI57_9POAL|nr:hypothetical protein HU200_035505 [Digitaria exilis]
MEIPFTGHAHGSFSDCFLYNYSCVHCVENQEETVIYLFFTCPFSEACWICLGKNIQWDLSLQPLQMIIQSRQQFGSCIFREIVIVACRSLWCHRNSIVFDGQSLSFARWKALFVEDTKKDFS